MIKHSHYFLWLFICLRRITLRDHFEELEIYKIWFNNSKYEQKMVTEFYKQGFCWLRRDLTGQLLSVQPRAGILALGSCPPWHSLRWSVSLDGESFLLLSQLVLLSFLSLGLALLSRATKNMSSPMSAWNPSTIWEQFSLCPKTSLFLVKRPGFFTILHMR